MKTHILKQPIITEKSMYDATNNVYTFEVDLSASKNQIREVVRQLFDVTVEKVTTSIRKPKTIRTGRKRTLKKTGKRKFAKVWLKQGETIDLFEFKEQ